MITSFNVFEFKPINIKIYFSSTIFTLYKNQYIKQYCIRYCTYLDILLIYKIHIVLTIHCKMCYYLLEMLKHIIVFVLSVHYHKNESRILHQSKHPIHLQLKVKITERLSKIYIESNDKNNIKLKFEAKK